MKRIIGIALLFCSVFFLYERLSFKNDSKKDAAKKEEVEMQVTASPVDPANIVQHRATYPAFVESIGSATIKASVSGNVTALRVRVGDWVSAGQLVALIENTGTSVEVSDIGLRSAELNQAELALSRAKNSYQEAKRLYGKDSTHANELAKETAKANYESAQITLQSLLDGHSIKSPVSGAVTSVSVDRGSSVSPGQPIITVGRIEDVRLVLFVSSLDTPSLSIGQDVTIDTNDHRLSTQGSVSSIGVQADPSTGKVRVEVMPDRIDSVALMVGTVVNVSISQNDNAQPKTMMIPLEALIVGQGGDFVFVLHKDDRHVRKVSVEVKSVQGGTAEVSVKNLQSTDRIIMSGTRNLDDGETVVVREE